MTTADILDGLLRVNLAAGVAILGVIVLRKLVRPRFGARLAYGLWLLPVLAGAAVLIPARQVVIVRAAAVVAASARVHQTFWAPGLAAPLASYSPGTAMIVDPPMLLVGLWLAGVASAALVMIHLQHRFVRAADAGAIGPAVVGVIAPRIVTPEDFAQRYSRDEQALVLAHEQAHIARQDSRLNGLCAAIQCLCWFNPLIHLAARLMRIDQELACDEAVVTRFPAARRAYAEVLLKAQLAILPLPLGCYWPSKTQHPLVERVAMLTLKDISRARRWVGAAALATLCAGAGLAAWAAQPADVRIRLAPAPTVAVAQPAPGLVAVAPTPERVVEQGGSFKLAAASSGGQTIEQDMRKPEEQAFQSAAESLREALRNTPELARHILVDQTPEGLRIQLIDQDGRSMFEQGSAKPNDRARVLLRAVARVVNPLPNSLTIAGYTSANADGKNPDADWALSAARAEAARQILQEAGVDAARVYQVSDRAASDPLYPDAPALAGNRRVALVLLRQAPLPVQAAAGSGALDQTPAAATPSADRSRDLGPIDITGDTATKDVEHHRVSYRGKVEMVADGRHLMSDQLDLYFLERSANGAAGRDLSGDDFGALKRAEADGHVTYVSADQTVTADHAVYDPVPGALTLSGDVVLTRGANVTHSDKLVIDMKPDHAATSGALGDSPRQGPSPGTEDSVRRWLASIQAHQPDDADMTPGMAQAVRQQAPLVNQIIRAFGALNDVRFVRVTPQGLDTYEADFTHGKIQVAIAPLTADGKVDKLSWGPIGRSGEPRT